MSFYVEIPNKSICQKSCQNDDKNTHFVPKNSVKPLFCYLVGYTQEMIKNETCQKDDKFASFIHENNVDDT